MKTMTTNDDDGLTVADYLEGRFGDEAAAYMARFPTAQFLKQIPLPSVVGQDAKQVIGAAVRLHDLMDSTARPKLFAALVAHISVAYYG